MDKPQAREYNQALCFLEFAKKNFLLQDDKFCQKVIAQIKSCIERVDSLKLVHFDKKCSSISKQKSRVNLEDICYQIANLMKSYGYFHHFIPFVHLDGFGRNQLYKYSGLKLLIKSRFLKDMIQKDPQESQEADIDESLRDQLGLAIAGFDKKLNSTTTSRDDIKRANQTIEDELNAYHQLLNKVLKPYMEAKYKHSQPDLYEYFVMAISTYKIPRRKRALQGKITDTDGKPLHRVRVSVDNKKAVVKRGTKGNYFFKNMTNGSHKILFSCEGFKSVTKNILIYPSRTSRLDIVMQREKAVELNERIASL
ncbi:carboxypeptidase-like regulatory domain-containing protein [Ancylomarina sp.]|uniref:carboxypeptidase-like regulatory domain-containing protein n=1 Tax=Ancylomarina sp. TaxID=1970196 RepID=UPI003568F4EA